LVQENSKERNQNLVSFLRFSATQKLSAISPKKSA